MNTVTRNTLLAFLISILISPIQISVANDDFSLKTVAPRNSIEQNTHAKQFIKELKKIVKAKNIDALMPYISTSIRFSFGDGSSVIGFLKFWKLLDHPEKSDLWKELDLMLKMGGVVEGSDSITFPYLFADWPDDFDAFEYKAITGSRVNFRKEPSANAEVIRQITYEVVRTANVESLGEEPLWERIRTHDNKVGYVHSNYIRSPIDFRMIFKKECNNWKMVLLVAGD